MAINNLLVLALLLEIPTEFSNLVVNTLAKLNGYPKQTPYSTCVKKTVLL